MVSAPAVGSVTSDAWRRMAGAATTAGAIDFLKHRGRGLKPQPRAVIGLRDQHREETRLGRRLDEFGGIGALAIERLPIIAGKARAEAAHRIADFRIALPRVVQGRPFDGRRLAVPEARGIANGEGSYREMRIEMRRSR